MANNKYPEPVRGFIAAVVSAYEAIKEGTGLPVDLDYVEDKVAEIYIQAWLDGVDLIEFRPFHTEEEAMRLVTESIAWRCVRELEEAGLVHSFETADDVVIVLSEKGREQQSKSISELMVDQLISDVSLN